MGTFQNGDMLIEPPSTAGQVFVFDVDYGIRETVLAGSGNIFLVQLEGRGPCAVGVLVLNASRLRDRGT